MTIKRRIIIMIGALGGASLVLAAVVVFPSVARIRDLRTDILTERTKIQRRYDLRNYVRNSIGEIQRTQTELATLKTIAIHEGEELAFVEALENAATATGVTMSLDLVTVNQEEISEWERWVPVHIQVSGNFALVMSFLNEMEHLPYYVILDTIQIASARGESGGPGDGNVTAIFNGNVYWQGKNVPAVLTGEEGITL